MGILLRWSEAFTLCVHEPDNQRDSQAFGCRGIMSYKSTACMQSIGRVRLWQWPYLSCFCFVVAGQMPSHIPRRTS